MEKIILNVEGMSCKHCVNAVTQAVNTLPGIGKVSVDLKKKTVTIKYDKEKSTLDKIKSEITEQGYEVIE